MVAVRFSYFPHDFVRIAYRYIGFYSANLSEGFSKKHLEIPTEYVQTNAAQLISVSQDKDIVRKRGELVTLLWGQSGIPTALPSIIDGDVMDKRYEDISSLGKIIKLHIPMEFGLDSNLYQFIPKKPNNRVVLYHEGHAGDFHQGKAQISLLLESGYSVVAFSMPLLGPNSQPTIDFPRLGKLKLTHHDQMKFLAPKTGHAVKYFIEPVIVTLNYLTATLGHSSVAMIGISGGGWTTTLAAAIDPRIKISFPVAGSYPIYLRSNSQNDWGDYEQTVPDVYKTANYLELYILGSYGIGRKQLQIFNYYDSCCFAGKRWMTYKDSVEEVIQKLGAGKFEIFSDTSHKEHIISRTAMNRILDELGTVSN